MPRLFRFFVIILALQMTLAGSAWAAEEIGRALAITASVTGDNGPLSANSPVHRDERIRTSASGTGQFEFRDGTKLAIGPGSTLVLDRSVFAGSSAFKKFTLKATRGTFRWVSGASSSSAYQINTPFGTLGIRGTVFDFFVNGSTATVILLQGQAEFCGNNGVCSRLRRGCDAVTANRNGVMEKNKDRSSTVVSGVRNEVAFPFLAGTRKLRQPFQVGGGRCGLSKVNFVGQTQGMPNRAEDAPEGGGDGGGGGGNDNGPG